MFRDVFFDLDNTLLDFSACECAALRVALQSFGVEMTDTMQQRYSAINDGKWKRFERGEIDRRTVQLSRFSDFFVEFNLSLSPTDFNARYLDALAGQAVLLPGATELLQKLSGKVRLYLASNGVNAVQRSRVRLAGLDRYFLQEFNSEFMGAQKPDPAFFDACFAALPGVRREDSIIIGDSLSSDILGGNNAGIATCWYNPAQLPLTGPARPDYTARSFDDIAALLLT